MTRKTVQFYLKIISIVPFISHQYTYAETTKLVIGGTFDYKPDYLGSDELNPRVSPYFNWTDGQWFVDSENGIGIYKGFENGFYISQAIGYSLGRSEMKSWWREGSDKLQGMGDIGASINSTTTFGIWMAKWIGIEGEIVAPFTESQGVAYRLKLNSLVYHDNTNSVLLSIQQNYGDARFNTTWFGVSQEQSKQSGYRNFELGNGLNSIENHLNWYCMLGNNWSGLLELTYTFIVDDARDSPIIQNRSSLSLSVGAYYEF